MKYKVLRRFKDKYTNATYFPNDIVELPEERVEEMNSTPLGIFVELVEEVPVDEVVVEEDEEEAVEDVIDDSDSIAEEDEEAPVDGGVVEEDEETSENKVVDLTKLKKEDLIELAKEKGLAVDEGMKKADIIALITEGI